MEWDLYYFVAKEARELEHSVVDAERTVEEAEDISTQFFDFANVRTMCFDGSINEERSALVLLKYLEKLA